VKIWSQSPALIVTHVQCIVTGCLMYCHWMPGALLSVHLFLYYIVSSGDRVDCPVTEWARYVQTMVTLLNYSSFNYKAPTYFLCRLCKVFFVGCVRCFFYGNRLDSAHIFSLFSTLLISFHFSHHLSLKRSWVASDRTLYPTRKIK
jgi:hypothetical protein